MARRGPFRAGGCTTYGYAGQGDFYLTLQGDFYDFVNSAQIPYLFVTPPCTKSRLKNLDILTKIRSVNSRKPILITTYARRMRTCVAASCRRFNGEVIDEAQEKFASAYASAYLILIVSYPQPYS